MKSSLDMKLTGMQTLEGLGHPVVFRCVPCTAPRVLPVRRRSPCPWAAGCRTCGCPGCTAREAAGGEQAGSAGEWVRWGFGELTGDP